MLQYTRPVANSCSNLGTGRGHISHISSYLSYWGLAGKPPKEDASSFCHKSCVSINYLY